MHKHFSLLDATRRHFFSDCGIGVGKMALASLLTGSVSNQATAGQAAGNLLTLIASARLHALDSEAYLRDLFRVLPHWPQGRYLELAPKYWLAARARLDPDQLKAELGPLTLPPELPPSAEQASAS